MEIAMENMVKITVNGEEHEVEKGRIWLR